MTKKWKVGEGTIYDSEQGGVLYDCLDDWLDKTGQQVLCDLMNEGWDRTPFDEVEPILNERLAAKVKTKKQTIRTSVELLPGQSKKLQEVALALGYVQKRGVGTGTVGSIAQLMQAIAKGEITVSTGQTPAK